jgi:hypothetical protein
MLNSSMGKLGLISVALEAIETIMKSSFHFFDLLNKNVNENGEKFLTVKKIE